MGEGDPANPKLYTLSDVSQHNNAADCWIVVHGKVYDVTNYLDEHPGGDDVLLEATGQDATDGFEDAGHSTDAREMMEKYFIGEIDPLSSSSKTISKPEHETSRKSFKTLTKILPYAVPVAIVGLAVLICFYAKKR